MSDSQAARRTLRPSAEEAEDAWRRLVVAEKQQTEDLPERPSPEDFYAPIADAFRADPRRGDEPLLDHLRALVRPDETWLDLGAGGGRYTLPIALLARRVYAVEPSHGMRDTLVASAAEHGIGNVEVFAERWPSDGSDAPIADVGFMSQVGYDIADIGAFLSQLEAHTKRVCIAVLYDRTPLSDVAPLWREVHGEERILLPGLAEFVSLLFARGRVPEISLLAQPPRTYDSLDALHRTARRPLWVLEGSNQDARLAAAVRRLATPVPGGVSLNPAPRRLGIVSWEPTLATDFTD